MKWPYLCLSTLLALLCIGPCPAGAQQATGGGSEASAGAGDRAASAAPGGDVVGDSPGIGREQPVAGPSGELPKSPTAEANTDAWLSRFRRIFFYEQHAPRLIPANFWPVSLDDLEAALLRESTPGQPGEERPQLNSAVYVARFESDALISDPDTSVFDLSYRDDAPGQLSLGPMNLAFEGTSMVAGGQAPRLVTSDEGVVQAIVYQDCRLRFGWSRRGELGPDGSYRFDLHIPPCGRTRFVVGMPEDVQLESLDGVVTAYPSPPQEARNSAGETELSWYGIEAGGLSRLRLIVRPRSAAENSGHLAIRQIGMDYAAAPEGLEWTARVVIDVPREQSLPPVTIPGAGRVTAVRVNTQPVRWKETTEAGETHLELAAPLASSPVVASPVSLEITGTAPLWSQAEGRDGEIQLPQIRFQGRRPWMALSETEAVLRVTAPLRLAQLIDEEGWTVDELSARDGALADRIYRITGPPGGTLPTLRLAVAEPWPRTTAALLLAVFPEVLRARWDAAIQLDAEGPQPLQFEFQPGWQIVSVSLLSSGRIIELPAEGGDSRPLTIWPEASDVVDGVLRIQFTGRRVAHREGDLETVPPTWFARLRGAVVQCVAAVVPPPDFDWVAGTVLRGRRLKSEELSADFAEMIGPIDGETLLFDTDDGLTPELQLRQPPPEFNAELHLRLQIEGDELVERLRVVCRLPSGRMPRLRVRLGPRVARPPMRWSMGESPAGGAAFQSLQADQIDEDVGVEEVWELSPPGAIRDQWVVFGQRRYPLPRGASAGAGSSTSIIANDADDSIALPLPSLPLSQVAQASSPRATVSIGPRLSLLGTEGPVLRVPNHAVDQAFSSAVGRSAEEMSAIANESGWLLRYDASSESSVTVRRETSAPPPPVVWDEQVEVLAGVGGGDEVRAAYRIDRGQTLELRFDTTMVVTEVEGADPEQVVAVPGRLRIPAPDSGGWIRVVLWRPSGYSQLLRKFHAPTIESSAVVLRRNWRLWTAPDTFALAASSAADPPAWMHQDTDAVATTIGPGQAVWLLPSGVAWAAGGVLALLAIGISGWLLRSVPWLVVAALGGLWVVVLLIPIWSTAVTGFLLMPLTAAGIFVSSGRVRPAQLSHTNTLSRSRTSGDAARNPSSMTGRPSYGKSPQAPSPRNGSSQWSLLWLTAAIGSAAIAHAAETEGPMRPQGAQVSDANGRGASSESRDGSGERSERRETAGRTENGQRREIGGRGEGDEGPAVAFPVMIPLKADGDVAGDKVYVPKAFYDSLFRPAPSDAEVGEIQFHSASYQVRITPSADRRVADSVTIEAVWRVEVASTDRPVRLPIDPAVLDRLEVVVDSIPNEVRPRPDGKSVLIRPPRSGLNILRATLSPEVEVNAAGGAGGFELPIPAVALANLSVSTDGSLAAVNLPNCLGRIEGADSGNRMTASLGPISDLVLLWQHGSTLPSASGEIDRRWWVHVGAEHVSRELEIAVGDVGRSGAVVELSGLGGGEPVVTTSDWTLDDTVTSDSTRSPLRLVARVDSPGPIRLLWVDPQAVADGGTIRLPDVRPTGFVGDVGTRVAVEAPDGWSIDASVAEHGEALPDVAEFFESWQGRRGAAKSAWRYEDVAEVALRVLPSPARAPTATEAQQLMVAAEHLRISYRGSVRAAGQQARPLRLLLPNDMRIESLRVDGEPTAAVVLPSSGESRELLLPQPSANDPSEIDLAGIVPISEDGQFAPPRIRLSGAQIDASRYHMFRSEGLQVRQLSPPPEVIGSGGPIDYDLLAGTAPLQSWSLSTGRSPTATNLGGRYHVAEASSNFAATSLTTLHWEDGLWTMEVTIDIEDFDETTAFLTVEVPTRWIEGLNVETAAKWSRQPANDPAVQLIRILPQNPPLALFAPLAPLAGLPAEGEGDLRIRITSTLESAAEGGVSVPDIRLLGDGPRRRFFSTPRRLTSTPIDWRTNARLIDPPADMQDIAPSTETHQFYEVAGESFSATLRPADGSADSARCTLLDVALFPHDSDSVLSLMRWDLLPGDREQVQFAIPRGVRVLGAWSSGTSTGVRPGKEGMLDVPVGLSRLAQQIVLLVTLPKEVDERTLPLPQLVGIPVTATWAARYDESSDTETASPSDGSPENADDAIPALTLETLLRAERMLSAAGTTDGQWREEDADAYRRALATATIAALDASVDNVAERTAAEKRHWLRPWFARLRQLGWPGVPSALAPEASDPAPASDAITAGDSEESSPTWAAVDLWAPRFLQRVLGSESDAALAVGGTSDAKWWIPPRSWSASQWMTTPGAAESVPESMIPPSIVPGDPAVRSLRSGWIALLTFAVAAVSLRLVGVLWLMHPAVWLVMLGLFSIPLLPLPVSVAITVLGLASPLLGRR